MNRRASFLNRGKSGSRAFFRAVFLSAIAAIFAIVSGCSSGGSSPSNGTAPTNLVYPQTTITATTGQPISAVTPSLTGTVTSFSVSPALPAGLSLNTTTGAITGTATASSPQTTYTITAANSAGTTTATVQITVTVPIPAPSNLVYPQTTISANVGLAITTDTPTVTGTVSAYSVSPALPAGLSINTTTGAISGTPTAVTAQATYTVTATNSSGSTTATLQITVNAAIPPPANLFYPETTIPPSSGRQQGFVTSVGQAIPPYIPTVTGTVTSFSVSPTLPAGLSFNATTGAITGTATATSPQTTYTVTASNPGGSTTTTLTITVNKALPVLLDVGHAYPINQLRVTANRVLSQDTDHLHNSHWALWDYSSNAEIASGDALTNYNGGYNGAWPVDIASQIFVIGQTNGLDVHAVSDGHLLFQISSPQIDSSSGGVFSWWKLATDGSYICYGSTSGLTVWSSSGQQLFNRSGDYSKANTFAMPGQVLIAGGPAGQNVIETVSASNGTSTTGAAFSGTFNSWFLDGQRFLTNTGTTVWIYSSATSTQQSIVSLPTVSNLAGEGNWFWTYSTTANPSSLNIYPVGGTVPSATFTNTNFATVIPSGNTIFLAATGPTASVVDLSGVTPVKTDVTLPVAYNGAYAATTASQWIVGNKYGVVLDGTSVSTTPRYFGTGQAWSIAGSTNVATIATANGSISSYSPSSSPISLLGTIKFSSSKIALSSDGSVLAALANANDGQYFPDRTLKIFSLPSGNLTYSFPSQNPGSSTLMDFSLSGSGTTIGQVLANTNNSPLTYSRQAVPATGGAAIWTDTGLSFPVNLSPDGTLIAASNGSQTTGAATNIYKNGLLATAVNGVAVGWIDNNQLLVNNYASIHPNPNVYTNASIYSASGTLSSSPTLSELLTIQPVTSSSIYSPTLNTIFSLPSGNTLYSSGTPVTGPAAVAGSYVVFASGSRIVVDTH
jgi:hypothetical protein